MDFSQIPVGVAPPWDIHAVIEIPQAGIPVKYELDKKSGAMFVDRFLHTSMCYPGNYGFIPQTLAEGGDPLDVIVVGQVAVVPGAVICCRPIGALIMRDEGGGDEKIVAVPVDKLHPFYSGLQSYKDLPPILTDKSRTSFSITRTWSRANGSRSRSGRGAGRDQADPGRHRPGAGCGGREARAGKPRGSA